MSQAGLPVGPLPRAAPRAQPRCRADPASPPGSSPGRLRAGPWPPTRDRDEDNHPTSARACRAVAGYERDHTARHRGDLLHGGAGTKRIACGDIAWPHGCQGGLSALTDAQQPQPVAAEEQQRGARGARPQRRPVEDRRYGQRHRCRGTAGRVVPRMAGPAQSQMNGDAAGDQHDGQARNQPPADRIAAIGMRPLRITSVSPSQAQTQRTSATSPGNAPGLVGLRLPTAFPAGDAHR